MHHSILSEGINVHGLSACIMLRGMDYIEIAQTVGRVIRLGEGKTFGLVNVPVFGKVGINTAAKVQKVVDIIFEQGDAAISTIRRWSWTLKFIYGSIKLQKNITFPIMIFLLLANYQEW